MARTGCWFDRVADIGWITLKPTILRLSGGDSSPNVQV
jgi:hypothetical protein